MSIFPTKILLDTDSSQNAQLARTTAVDMATTTGSELHVVSVAPSLPPYDGYHCHDVRILDEQVQKIERDGGKVTQKHLKIAKLIGERHRAQQILRVAEDIDAGLIVMGTRRRGGVQRALVGSVCDTVVRHAHCPVLVVRPEKEQAA
jgi:nucleotide-binding universal stress UspA family protein